MCCSDTQLGSRTGAGTWNLLTSAAQPASLAPSGTVFSWKIAMGAKSSFISRKSISAVENSRRTYYTVEINYNIPVSKFIEKVEKCRESTIDVEIYDRAGAGRGQNPFGSSRRSVATCLPDRPSEPGDQVGAKSACTPRSASCSYLHWIRAPLGKASSTLLRRSPK